MNDRTRQAIADLARQRQALIERLLGSATGEEWCHLQTALADQVVTLVFADLEEAMPDLPALSIVATGGYGRGELAPYSDVDLAVIPSDEAHPGMDAAIRTLFRDLHGAFGTDLRIDVGYAYMLINDAPGMDAKSRTGLLDSRLIVGSAEPYAELMDLFWDTLPVGEFLLSRIREREEAIAKRNGSPLVVEPDLKDGAGGLRSFQCANWMRAAIRERPARAGRSYERVLRYRNLLHAVAGKRQEVLTRSRQAEIAERTGREMVAMMGEIVEAGADLHREYLQAKERLHESRFSLAEGVVALRGEARLAGPARLGEAATGIAFATQLGLRVSDLPMPAAPAVSGPEALYAIGAGEAALRNLDRCGLLEALMPELTRCRYLLPTDTSHEFTVFEHTMRAVRNLDSLMPGSFLGDLKAGMHDADALYLAVLLHDVGKVASEANHADMGEELAREVCGRWGLASELTDMVGWLVKNHLAMSVFTRMRDVLNPSTAAEFAQLVRTPDHLDMLTLLTWADTSAVAPDAWTPAQESFLRELHDRASAVFEGAAAEEPDATVYRRRLRRELRDGDATDAEVEAFLDSLQAHYLLSTPAHLARVHMRFAQKARKGEPTVELHHLIEIGTTDVTVCAPDAPGLLSKILAVFYALDLSLHSIRASTTQTDVPVAIDTFTVSFGGRSVPHATCRQLSASLTSALKGQTSGEEVLRERGKDPERRQQFYRYTYHEGSPGILEFQAPRGRGMAYRLSRLIAEQGWNIVSARVGQWAGRGAAAFYVLDGEDRPLSKSAVEEALAGQV